MARVPGGKFAVVAKPRSAVDYTHGPLMFGQLFVAQKRLNEDACAASRTPISFSVCGVCFVLFGLVCFALLCSALLCSVCLSVCPPFCLSMRVFVGAWHTSPLAGRGEETWLEALLRGAQRCSRQEERNRDFTEFLMAPLGVGRTLSPNIIDVDYLPGV